jgi:hypothetical protein
MTICKTPLALAALALLASACAEPESAVHAVPLSEVESGVASDAALAIEQAQRLLDRGGDSAAARKLLDTALQDPHLDAQERIEAVLAMSRLHELDGRQGDAASVVERELGDLADDAPKEPYRERLRELLAKRERPPYLGEQHKQAPPFSRVLSRYFSVGDDGKVALTSFLVGGDRAVSNDAGTFNIGAAIRAEREAACPLCDAQLSVRQSRHRGDWVMIPEARAKFGDALVVFYFDLEHNHIPARYESLMPMNVAALEAELEAGKSFVLANERPDAPPVLLLAAPRSAMLGDLERRVAQLDELPTEARYFDVDNRLRPNEIRAVVRGTWVPEVRACYEALRAGQPDAEGRIVATVEVGAEGAVTALAIDSEDASLTDETFVDCLRTSGLELSFPAIGTTTTVRYPLVLNGD